MFLKCSFIDKLFLIGLIVCVFFWEDELYIDIIKFGNGIKEDEDWYYFIKMFLKIFGFSGSDLFMIWWYLLDSFLDLLLRDRFVNKEFIKCRN